MELFNDFKFHFALKKQAFKSQWKHQQFLLRFENYTRTRDVLSNTLNFRICTFNSHERQSSFSVAGSGFLGRVYIMFSSWWQHLKHIQSCRSLLSCTSTSTSLQSAQSGYNFHHRRRHRRHHVTPQLFLLSHLYSASQWDNGTFLSFVYVCATSRGRHCVCKATRRSWVGSEVCEVCLVGRTERGRWRRRDGRDGRGGCRGRMCVGERGRKKH